MMTRLRAADIAVAGVTLAIVMAVPVLRASAQERRIAAVVEHIAGGNLYVTPGADSGLVAHDTLWAEKEGQERRGRLVVVSAASHRAVLAFVDNPFAITRGDVLTLTVNGDVAGQVVAARVVERESRDATRTRYVAPLRARGRLALDVNGLQTITRGAGANPVERERTFAAPAVRFSTTVSNLPGGLRFQTRMRASGRYSSGDIIDPVQSVRLYEASLVAPGRNAQWHGGRFYNPYETFSGYWDGMMLRMGGRGFGVGLAAGFEPDRANERFTPDIPKLTGFANLELRGKSVRYSTDVSFHMLRPRTDYLDRTFVGWSQDLRMGPLQLSHRMQIDRDPVTNEWVFSNIRIGTSARLSQSMRLYGRYQRRRPYTMWRTDEVFSYQREQADVGVSFSGRPGTLTFDVTGNRIENGDIALAYGSSFSVTQTPILGLGISASGRYTKLGQVTAMYLSPGISRTVGKVNARAYYHLYRTELGTQATTTHAGDLSLTFPLANRLYSSLRFRGQQSRNLTSYGVYTSLWVSF